MGLFNRRPPTHPETIPTFAPGAEVKATFQTSAGTFTAKLFAQECPITVGNFVGLATGETPWTDAKTGEKTNRPLYDGTVFHRVISGFMLQGGDPLGNGTGGPGFNFDDEFNDSLRHNKPGILSMANRGPGTNGSQFFVTEVPTPHLDDRHSVFGEVVEGMDVVKQIAQCNTGPGDRPNPAITLEKVVISIS